MRVPEICKVLPPSVPLEDRHCPAHPQEVLIVCRNVLVFPACRSKRGRYAGRFYPRRCVVCNRMFLADCMQQICCGAACARRRRNLLRRR